MPPNTRGILGLVGGGLGVSIYAEGLKQFQPQRVMFKPIIDCATEIETILCRNRANQSPALRNFVKMIEAAHKASKRAATR